MARLAVKSVSIADQFEARHYTGCDGWPAANVFSPVMVETMDGREFYLPMAAPCPDWFDEETGDSECGYGYYARYDANEMLKKIERRGSINPDHWVELEARPSLEEVLGPYGLAWQEEQQDRMAWAA